VIKEILSLETVKRIKELRDQHPEYKETMLNDKVILSLGVLHCFFRSSHNNPEKTSQSDATTTTANNATDWSLWIDSLPKEYSTLPITWSVSRFLAAKEILPPVLWESALKTKCLFLECESGR